MCALSAKLAKLRDIRVTVFIAPNNYAKVVDEIAANFEEGEDALQARIRIAALQAHAQNMFDYDVIGPAFEAEYQKLLSGQAIHCVHTQKDLPALTAPRAVIIDIMSYPLKQIASKLSSTVKVVCIGPSSVLGVYALSGASALQASGQTFIEEKIQEYMQKNGVSLREAANAVVKIPSDEIITIPGFPKVYFYEANPQARTFEAPLGFIRYLAMQFLKECDAFISGSMECVEPEGVVEGLSDFFARTSRKLYLLGPLLPMTKRSDAVEARQAAKSPEIASFLKTTLETRGERSMIYMSFGTIFWTIKPQIVWTFLDVMIEKKIPFIMSHASPEAKVPDELQTKVKASGTGLLVPWAPQQAILEHPATGWFVTHAGFNSVVESIYAGVPMICWPFAAEQPLNAIQLTENLGVAYELLEVRTGDGLRPIYRTGKAPAGTLDAVRAEAAAVLDKAFGADGEAKRAKVRELRETSLRLWAPDGAAARAGEDLLDSLQ